MRRIAIITGSRADESPLRNVIRLLGDNCIHIKTEGLYGHEETLLAHPQLQNADLVVLLGDRYETLVCASVAALLCIPIVHLHGGEITEGAVDDAFRHAISKLSYFHFVCHAKYKARLERLGESPERIFVTGAPSVDALVDEPMSIAEIERQLGIKWKRPVGLIAYHPETLGDNFCDNGVSTFAKKIKNGNEWECETLIITGANCDTGGEKINNDLEAFATASGYIYRKTYPYDLWLSMMNHADVLIGNSSSFIFEGLTMGQEVIMIGERQKGRYEDAVRFFKRDAHAFGQPGQVSPRIVELLMTLPIPQKPRKVFYE